MDFVAIDFEKATSAPESICQIGMVRFRDGVPVETFSHLVFQPKFDWYATKNIHGIKAKHVKNQPTLGELFPTIVAWLTDGVVVCHSKEERRSIVAAQKVLRIGSFPCRWVDTVKVAEKVWPQLREQKIGYGLVKLTSHFAIPHDSHDAVSDATATGMLFVRALQESGKAVSDFIQHEDANAEAVAEARRRRQRMKFRHLSLKMTKSGV